MYQSLNPFHMMDPSPDSDKYDCSAPNIWRELSIGRADGACVGPGEGTIPYAFRCCGRTKEVKQEDVMGRGLLLWLLGIPIPIIILIWVLGGLHG